MTGCIRHYNAGMASSGGNRFAQWLARGWPALADMLVLAAFIVAQPGLELRLRHPQASNLVLVLSIYCASCCGIYLLRGTRRTAGTSAAAVPAWIALLGVSCGMFTTIMALLSAGWFEPGSPLYALDMNRGRDTALMTAGAVMWLLLAFLPLLALYAEPLRLPTGAGQHIVAGLGVMLVNCLIAVTAAWWAAQTAGADQLEPRYKLVAFLPVYAVLALFYAPPRLLLGWSAGDRSSLGSFAICLGVYAWRIL